MPQIWLTYDELAALMNCNPARAREAAIAFRLDRRKSRDGRRAPNSALRRTVCAAAAFSFRVRPRDAGNVDVAMASAPAGTGWTARTAA